MDERELRLGQETSADGQKPVGRLKGWLNRHFPAPARDLVPQREPAADILARTILPDRSVTLGDINLYRALPINWQATLGLAEALNDLKETPIDTFDIANLKPDPSVYDGIPWVASVIANHYNPEIPILYPNEEEIARMKPWLRGVSRFLGRFSEGWQVRFGRYVEGSGEAMVKGFANNVLSRADLIGEIGRPREEFVPELGRLFNRVSAPQYELEEAVMPWDTDKKVAVPVESKMQNLLLELAAARQGDQSAWINHRSYPLISRILEISGFPSKTFLEGNMVSATVGASEVMVGVEEFLRRRGIYIVNPAEKPVKTFDFWDGNTWNMDSIYRSVAETNYSSQLAAVVSALPSILNQVEAILPENGPEVVAAVQKVAEDILILSKQGVSNGEIAAALFRKS